MSNKEILDTLILTNKIYKQKFIMLYQNESTRELPFLDEWVCETMLSDTNFRERRVENLNLLFFLLQKVNVDLCV